MIKRPINYIFLEGPDLSGKTTFYEQIHKNTKYRWNIQDRSALSMVVHAKQYGRENFRHVEQLRSELNNLNNIMIILLPEWQVIAERFNKRGDPIQNLSSLKKIHGLFEEAAKELEGYPNVLVLRSEIDNVLLKHVIDHLFQYENAATKELQQNCLSACFQKTSHECVGLNFTIFDDGKFLDVSKDALLYEKEVDYYDEISSKVIQKINKELSGDNPYNRKETLQSRRFIYESDTCISLAHFLLRQDGLDCKFFLRSSNVKDTLYYDLNFMKHLSSQVYNLLNIENKFCRMNFVINSAHILIGGEHGS